MDALLLQSALDAPVGAMGGFWNQHGDALQTLARLAGGILVYGLLVNAFYQIISKRVMFAGRQVDGRTAVGGPGRGFVYLMMFPFVSFLFFLLISASLLFLSGGDQQPIQVFTLAMALVLAVRIAAYFSEATSHDLAKMLPLGLLGVALVRAEVQGLVASTRDLFTIFDHAEVIGLYFVLVVVAEYLLRSIYLIVGVGGRSRSRQPKAT